MLDGMFASVSLGLTGNYITPYALTMQATTQQIGYLTSFPSFANMLVMLMAPLLTERVGNRKKIILPGVLIQALLYLPMLALVFIFPTNQVWWLIALVTLSTAAGGIIGPPWGAMMADLVPTEMRGSYFGTRNRINSIISLIFSFVAGGLLQIFTGDTRLAFMIIFAGAFVGRIISLYFLAAMVEPHTTIPESGTRESLAQITRGLFSTNIGRFIIFAMFLSFAQSLGAPFFSPYILKELKINYMSYQIINAFSIVVQFLVMTWWGKHADRFGNRKILRICSLMIPFVPMLWLVSPNVVWICTVQVYSGFAWAGFNLCAGLFIYDAAPPENRARYIALHGALSAAGAMMGAFVGGNIGDYLPQIKGSNYLTLFLLSGVLRLAVVLLLFRKIEEVREVEAVKTTELLFGKLRPSELAKTWQNFYHRVRRIRTRGSK